MPQGHTNLNRGLQFFEWLLVANLPLMKIFLPRLKMEYAQDEKNPGHASAAIRITAIFFNYSKAETCFSSSQFAGRSYKIGRVVGTYPASISIPLLF